MISLIQQLNLECHICECFKNDKKEIYREDENNTIY